MPTQHRGVYAGSSLHPVPTIRADASGGRGDKTRPEGLLVDSKQIKALDNLGRGRMAEHLARSSELGMSRAASKVAGARGMGQAVLFQRDVDAKRKAKRVAARAARRGNR